MHRKSKTVLLYINIHICVTSKFYKYFSMQFFKKGTCNASLFSKEQMVQVFCLESINQLLKEMKCLFNQTSYPL